MSEQPGPATGPSANDEKQSQNWLMRLRALVGGKPALSARTDIEDALEESSRTDDFSPKERSLLQNVLGFKAIRLKDVMIPRADIIAVPASTSLRELLNVFRTAAHSRLPVYGETLDDPKGMIHIRDYMNYVFANADADPGGPEPDAASLRIDLSEQLSALTILRPVLYAPPSMPAIELLARMQTTRTHMALVVDEYGGTDGLVSIEDLVEVIVGDIEDEHDESADPQIIKNSDGSFTADARASISLLEAVMPEPLPDDPAGADTIGGLIAQRTGRVPARGELVAIPEGVEFEILDADARRIKRVKIYLPKPAAPLRPGGQNTQAGAVPAQAEKPSGHTA